MNSKRRVYYSQDLNPYWLQRSALEIGFTTKYHKLPMVCSRLGIWEVILENEKNYIKMSKMLLVDEIKKYFNNRHSPRQRPDTNVGMWLHVRMLAVEC